MKEHMLGLKLKNPPPKYPKDKKKGLRVWFGLFSLFNGKLTFVGYLMPTLCLEKDCHQKFRVLNYLVVVSLIPGLGLQ